MRKPVKRLEHEKWIDTATGVHEPDKTCETACVIHSPSIGDHRLMRLNWRSDRGIFERLCEHGIGHPDPDQNPHWEATGQDWQNVHGCDGCCGDWVTLDA